MLFQSDGEGSETQKRLSILLELEGTRRYGILGICEYVSMWKSIGSGNKMGKSRTGGYF